MHRTLMTWSMTLAVIGCYPDKPCTDCTDSGTDSEIDALGYEDSDGDTIYDIDEGDRDSDGDTIADYLDEDSDDDGWPDSVEAGDDDPETRAADSDFDDVPDYLDEDSDANGIDDIDEPAGDTDGDGDPDRIDLDDDDDFCIDPREGSATRVDTDGDTTPDYLDTDSDDDTIDDIDESCMEDCDDDLVPNRVDTDSDNNGIDDIDEGVVNTDETTETSPDDVPDFCDPDNDGDGLTDVEEMTIGTDPLLWDSDSDGDFDYLEIVVGSDPLDTESSVPDDVLIVGPTNTPLYTTVTTRLPRVDLAILANTGGDMTEEIEDLSADLPGALSTLSTVVDDLEVSIVGYEDFGDQGFGVADSEPLTVYLPSTSDTAAISTGLTDLLGRATLMEGSIDERGCGVEAIYQMITGTGMGVGGIIPHADCMSSPLDPVRFGASCIREDSYTIMAVLSDRMSWSPQGCLSLDTDCTYDEELFPAGTEIHRYPDTLSEATNTGVRVFGVVANPATTLSEDHRTWIERFAQDTSTVATGGTPMLVDLADDPTTTTEQLIGAVTTLLTSSGFVAGTTLIDLPDADPQPDGFPLGYGLAAYPTSCDPASGDWGSCGFSANFLTNVGPDVEVTIRLFYTPPSVHPRVDVLAFELQFAVSDRMVIDSRQGYLIVPKVWNPDL